MVTMSFACIFLLTLAQIMKTQAVGLVFHLLDQSIFSITTFFLTQIARIVILVEVVEASP